MGFFDYLPSWETVGSWLGGSEKPTKRKRSTKSSPKKRKTDSGSQDVPSNPIQITSIEPLGLDPTSSMLADAYEKVFYKYADDGNIFDEAKVKEITKGIYAVSDNSLHKISELLNDILRIHDFLKENNYVKPVINLIAVISTLKIFDICEKDITIPSNLTVAEYCKFIDEVIQLRKIHTTYATNLQIYQQDLESKKTQLKPYVTKFKSMIDSKRSGNSIANASDSNNYETLILKLNTKINNEMKNNDKLQSTKQTESLIKYIFESLSDSDLELIKKMKSSIKCKGIDGSGFELDKLVEFLESIDNLLTKNLKSAKDCFESGDKKYCRKIYNIIETMIDPIVKENKKSIDEINRENRKIEGYKNELNKLYLNMGNSKSPRILDLEDKKRISEENIVKNNSIIINTREKLNSILTSFNQYGDMLKSINYSNKTILRRKLDSLKGVGLYSNEYEKLVRLFL